MVKSKSKTKNRFFPRSSKANFKLEMNDIIGNYTAIKKDTDQRKYVDLSKKIDFQDEAVISELREEQDSIQETPEDIDDFFDKIGVDEGKD